MNQPIEPYVFLGRPGAGKGTQAALLIDYLKRGDSSRPVYYMETGALLREFKSRDNYTSRLTQEVIDNGGGGLTLAFLAIYNWANFFINNLKGGERVVIDGTPRTVIEAEALDTAFRFYGASKSTIIHLDVHDDWSVEKLLKRAQETGRADDTEAGIKKRLSWFMTDVAPVVDYYRTHSGHTFLDINGLQTIPEVHQEIIGKIGL
ncbi:nucleoside monophosphate kinase [Candidatus Nomurabacteria bacterium]|nr:nucleoside monophosphate kinase [Candidatus Nomurabacteria bacterium]